ncbi:hypothetical protein [Hanstruepera marina]|uniref:hypothetical protein n=1 Tax=Hanstruepera marina TaxID=2873265 RepID=UPI001CA61E73|nr:hypothetical protein [Hanstruepera marina]
MKKILLLLGFIIISSCIPTQIAPNIETDKVQIAKKFKRDLPKNYAFIFQDTKRANEFYNFINMKYNRKHIDVEYNVPFMVNKKTYYMSFHEREKSTQTINLIPIFVDAARESSDKSPLMQDYHVSRTGNWYIVLTVSDDDFQDCLKPEYANRDLVIHHLRELQKEYFRTHNYLEAYLNNN